VGNARKDSAVASHDTPVSDADLIHAWRSGDRDAAGVLFSRHATALTRFLDRHGASAVEDLRQETFARCLLVIDTFRGESSFRTFLLAIATNVRRDHARRAARINAQLDYGYDELTEYVDEVESTLDARRRRARLADSIRRLPAGIQEVVQLYYWSGMSSFEIGEVLNMPAASVRRRRAAGLRRLAASIRK
jgi:RNA polymerase sigma factor (sigma-70 family)